VKALRDVFGDTLVDLGKTNPNVVVLDAETDAEAGGVT
jgi:transketolase C-terminal domain/subunit